MSKKCQLSLLIQTLKSIIHIFVFFQINSKDIHKNNALEIQFLPDTGASIDTLNLKSAKHKNSISKIRRKHSLAVNGLKLRLLGQITSKCCPMGIGKNRMRTIF